MNAESICQTENSKSNVFQGGKSFFDRQKERLISRAHLSKLPSNMEVIKNQLFDNSRTIRTDNPDKLPRLSECSLSTPTVYKAKTTSAWIITVCSEIWTRLLSSRRQDSNSNDRKNQISGSELVSYLMSEEDKTDRSLICGICQVLLDEKAIETIPPPNSNQQFNSIEFYDKDDVFYVCNRLKDKRLSIEEALATTEICPNITEINNTEGCETLSSMNKHPNDHIARTESQTILGEKNIDQIDVDDTSSIEDGYQVLIDRLYRLAPEALFRKILQKPPSERSEHELEYVYQELLLVPALASFSMSVRQELCKCLRYEVHQHASNVVFYQGDPGISWYIICRGSVWVHVDGQGYVCRLCEGDDFGKLALVTDAPRAASIILAEDNCHFLKLDKDDFNRILRNVEANTVRLKKNNSNVLILERIQDVKFSTCPQAETSGNFGRESNSVGCLNYSIIAGTVEHILHYLIESRLNGLENQLNLLISDEMFPVYLCPRTPIGLDQTWQNFFLTYLIFSTNKEILVFLYEYLGCDKVIESLHTEDHSGDENCEKEWRFPNGIQFDIIKINRVVVLFYIWRYCLGLSMFANQDGVNQFIMNLRTALKNSDNVTATNNVTGSNTCGDSVNVRSFQLQIVCLDKLLKRNSKLMIVKPISGKQQILPSNFLHFPCNFLRTLPFVCTNKRGMSKMHKQQFSSSGDHNDLQTSVSHNTNQRVKSFEIQDVAVHGSPNHAQHLESKSNHISTPSLLFGFQIYPNNLPLVKTIHTVTFNIYISELQKQVEVTVPIESTVYEIKQSMISDWQLKSEINDLRLVEVFSKGDCTVYQDTECGVMFGLSLNGRLFLTSEKGLQSLVPLAEQLSVAMNFLDQTDADRVRSSHQHETTAHWSLINDIPLLKKNRSVRAAVKLLDELNVDELAATLSCCHAQLAVCIHPQELLDFVIGGSKTSNPCPHVRTLVRRFSLLHAWTITQIVTTCNLTRRANLVKKLIKLADRLISPPLYDLYSSFAILLGLQNSAITRLTHTWERVPNRWRRILNDSLLPLIDPAKNHRAARLWNNYTITDVASTATTKSGSIIGVSNSPRLPFLALILKDLRFGEDANQTEYQQSEDGIRLINFEKMRLIARSLRSWINSISGYEMLHPHNHFISPEINKTNSSSVDNITVQKLLEVPTESQMFVLEHLECIDDPRVITQLSLRLEPKK
uniref:Rap guanine nucleotide exchange factor 6 n=1 Tax=Trichobilharzia regenti TaxID=157069 RepID=A0AA85KDL7_TRIRE|nr:unnamed protein product [Trichobilharzia regenti]